MSSLLLCRFTSLAASLLVFSSCAFAAAGVDVVVKDNKGALVADAVISLVPLTTKPVLLPPSEPVVIAQENQEFVPYVTAVVVGTRVTFPNQDRVEHQVFSVSESKSFEIPLSGPGKTEPQLFDRPGIVSVGCNIHDWMSAHIVVLETPYFLKTTADGHASFASLPFGSYRLDIWHPRLANSDTIREVVIAAGDTTIQKISIVLKPDRRIRRAPDGLGGGYKE